MTFPVAKVFTTKWLITVANTKLCLRKAIAVLASEINFP